jgi:peptidoglycan/LPS O-acetylase OafA/YrhL
MSTFTTRVSSRSKTPYVPTLDGWRAVAITGVITYHIHQISVRSINLRPIQDVGAFGVQLFFAISGILICSRLIAEENLTGTISLRNFYLRRIFRIQPAALVYLVVIGCLARAHVIAFSLRTWLAALFSVRNFYGSNPYDGSIYTAHFWSLGVEEHFYLLLPILLLLTKGKKRIALFTMISIVGVIWTMSNLHVHLASARSGRTDLSISWLLVPATLSLFLNIPTVRDQFTKVLRPVPLILLVLLGAMTLVFVMKLRFINMFLCASVSPMVLSTVLHPNSLPGRILESWPLRAVGKISYSLYLWQQIFCLNSGEIPLAGFPLSYLQVIPTSLVATLVCAIFSYFFVEKPLIRCGHYLSNARRSPV